MLRRKPCRLFCRWIRPAEFECCGIQAPWEFRQPWANPTIPYPPTNWNDKFLMADFGCEERFYGTWCFVVDHAMRLTEKYCLRHHSGIRSTTQFRYLEVLYNWIKAIADSILSDYPRLKNHAYTIVRVCLWLDLQIYCPIVMVLSALIDCVYLGKALRDDILFNCDLWRWYPHVLLVFRCFKLFQPISAVFKSPVGWWF